MNQKIDNSKIQNVFYDFLLYCIKYDDEKYIVKIKSVSIAGVPHWIVLPHKPERRQVQDENTNPLPLGEIINLLHRYNEMAKDNSHFKDNQKAISYIKNDLQKLEAGQSVTISVKAMEYQQQIDKGRVITSKSVGCSYNIKYSPIFDLPEADVSVPYQPAEQRSSQVDELSDLWRIFDSKRQELKELKADIKKTQLELESHRNSYSPDWKKEQELKLDIDKLERQQYSLTNEMPDLQDIINKKTKSYIEQIQGKLSERDLIIENQQKQIQSIEEKNTPIEADKLKEKFNQIIERQFSDYKAKREKYENLIQRLYQSHGIEQLQGEIQKLNNQVSTLQTQVSAKEKENEQIEQTLQDKTKEAEEINAKYNGITQELKNTKDKVAELEKELEQKEQEYEAFQQQLAQQIQQDVEALILRASELRDKLKNKYAEWKYELETFTGVLEAIKPRDDYSLPPFKAKRNLLQWQEQIEDILEILSPLASDDAEQPKRHLGYFFEKRSLWEQQLNEMDNGLSSLQINWQEHAKILVSSLDLCKQNGFDANVNNLETRIQEFIEKVGLQLIVPQPGDLYNPKLHIIQSERSFPNIVRGRIGEVLIRGVKNESEVLQKAQVIISKGN